MNNIKNTIILFLLSVSLSVVAQEMSVYNTTAGNLSSVIGDDEIATLREVKLTGSVNAADFFFIRDNIKELKTIDLTEVNIEACVIDGTSYAANEIPAYAFYTGCCPASEWATCGPRRVWTQIFPFS